MSAWTEEALRHRFLHRPPPARRAAPVAPASVEEDAPPRGDHDLNPDYWQAGRALRPAAVLVPIVLRPGEPTLLFTRRTAHLRSHAGQISFPGGGIEPEDASPEAAALRETLEEVGLPPNLVAVLGRLDTYVTRTGFEVTPVVGLLRPPLELRLDPQEVAEAFEVPLPFFLEPASRRLMSREIEGRARHFYAYPYGDRFIWGATAGMLNNLVEILLRSGEERPVEERSLEDRPPGDRSLADRPVDR